MTTWTEIARWLRARGFVEAGHTGGHLHLVHSPTGVKLTLTALGRSRREPKRGELGSVIRQLERCGFDRRAVRQEWGC